MKKIFLLIQSAALLAGVQAHALVGGPFDNGEYSILNERSGFYQTNFSFRNGSGYAIWTADNLIGVATQGTQTVLNTGTGSLLTPSTGGALSEHNGNRSILYYKGVTYAGSAYGSADVGGRKIEGYVNASSESDSSATATTQQQSGFFGQTSTSTTSTSTVVATGRSYVVNLGWFGDITATAPTLRFEGEGELTIIAPNGRETLAGLAFEGYSGLIQAINSSIAGIQNLTLIGTTTGFYQQGSDAIRLALTDLTPYLTGTGPSNSYAESEHVQVKVSGLRRYF